MTLGIHDFGLFLASALLLNLTPGQDTLYILGRTLSQGRASGVTAAFGVSAGTAVHSIAAALGVSAIIAASDAAFTVMKLIGAAYLVYLGIGLWRTDAPLRAAAAPLETSAASFRQGMLTNVTNPKVALFFLAFLPQFVDPAGPNHLAALLVLCLTFVSTSTLWGLLLVAGAERIRRMLRASDRCAGIFARTAGVLFIALGLRLAFAER
jgi:threonine/homoserine/homoserine lactone efflux protein